MTVKIFTLDELKSRLGNDDSGDAKTDEPSAFPSFVGWDEHDAVTWNGMDASGVVFGKNVDGGAVHSENDIATLIAGGTNSGRLNLIKNIFEEALQGGKKVFAVDSQNPDPLWESVMAIYENAGNVTRYSAADSTKAFTQAHYSQCAGTDSVFIINGLFVEDEDGEWIKPDNELSDHIHSVYKHYTVRPKAFFIVHNVDDVLAFIDTVENYTNYDFLLMGNPNDGSNFAFDYFLTEEYTEQNLLDEFAPYFNDEGGFGRGNGLLISFNAGSQEPRSVEPFRAFWLNDKNRANVEPEDTYDGGCCGGGCC